MMRMSLVVFLALCAVSAAANSPEPSDKDVVGAAQTCTAQGAFGVRFGSRPPSVPKPFGTDIGPFHVTSTVASDSYGVHDILAIASFAKAPMSQEDRTALADLVFRKLDHEIAATRKFARREAQQDLTLYTFNEGFLLEVVRLGTEVRLSCTHGSRDSISPNPLPQATSTRGKT